MRGASSVLLGAPVGFNCASHFGVSWHLQLRFYPFAWNGQGEVKVRRGEWLADFILMFLPFVAMTSLRKLQP